MPVLSPRRVDFTKRRYWYHISGTLDGAEVRLYPRRDGQNRAWDEPAGARICVAPTIEQCIIAIPYYEGEVYTIYRTKSKVLVKKAEAVFDSKVTDEGWIERPLTFSKIGTLDMSEVAETYGDDFVKLVCSDGDVRQSRAGLRWWRKVKVKQFIKKDHAKA